MLFPRDLTNSKFVMHPTMLNDEGFKTELCVQKVRTQLAMVSFEMDNQGIPVYTRDKSYGLVDQLATLGNLTLYISYTRRDTRPCPSNF